jgi:hypothetical protein
MAWSNANDDGLVNLTNGLLKSMHLEIQDELKYGNVTEGMLNVVVGADGEYVFPQQRVTEMMQQWQKAFLPKGQFYFSAEKIMVRRSMIDHSFSPQDMYERWYSKIGEINVTRRKANLPNMTPEQYPLQLFIVEEITKQLIHEEETIVVGKGHYKQAVANTVGRAKYTVDGFIVVLRQLVKAGKVKLLSTDTFTDDQVVEFMDDLHDQIAEIYQMKEMVAVTSIRNRKKFGKKYKSTYADGLLDRQTLDLTRAKVYIEDTNTEIVGLPGFSATKLVVITPRSNMYKVWSNTLSPMQVKNPVKEFLIMGDWARAYGFGYAPTIFAGGELLEVPNFVSLTSTSATGFTVKIEEMPGATHYDIQLDNNADFSSPVSLSAGNAQFDNNPANESMTLEDGNTSYTFNCNKVVSGVSTLSAGTYYVRVRAVLKVDSGTPYAGDVYVSQWSAAKSFVVA